MSHFMCFMSHNTCAVMRLFNSLLAVCVDPLLASFNIVSIYNFLTLLLGDLASIFLGVFLALHFLLVFTVMLMTRISSTLVVSTMPIVTCVVLANNLGIMTNNVRVVINLLVFFLAMSDDNILTLLNLSHINNNIILNMAFLMMLLFGCLVALVILLVLAMRTTVVTNTASICFSLSLDRRDCAVSKDRGEEDN